LREHYGWTGLMMDGSNYRPEINLQKEFIFSHNIVQLFEKYNVSKPYFDQLTVDIDMNNFWAALAVLRGGYRPRSFTVEFNRNLDWNQEYATVDFPNDMWKGEHQQPARKQSRLSHLSSSQNLWGALSSSAHG
jgi:hypothetical protein